MKEHVYGGFAACYIAASLEPEQIKKPEQSTEPYIPKPRKKRDYKKKTL